MCGHTGSNNRGCEAIVRSTAQILKDCGVENSRVYSYGVSQDLKRNLNDVIDVQPYKYRHKLIRGFYKYVLKSPVKSHVESYLKIIKNEKPAVMVCVGGDTYCFKNYYSVYAINIVGERFNIPTVLWGCSIDDSALENETLRQNIQKYKHIVARESMTYDILQKCVWEQIKINVSIV